MGTFDPQRMSREAASPVIRVSRFFTFDEPEVAFHPRQGDEIPSPARRKIVFGLPTSMRTRADTATFLIADVRISAPT
jgi:hypothetical protein